jgi:hypothetical protein
VCLLQAHDAVEKAEQEFTRLFTEIQKEQEQIETGGTAGPTLSSS